MTTLTHNGKAFTAEPVTAPEDKASGAEFTIKDKTGNEYLLVRNVPHPDLLFAIRLKRLSVPHKWWFTDKDGPLRSLTP